jgi:hypothetical protein
MKMNARNNRLIAISMLMGLVTLGVLPSFSLAFNNNQFQEAQSVDPFVEMLPGVYVAYELQNDSGHYSSNDTVYPTYPTYPVTVYPSTSWAEPGGTGSEPAPTYFPGQETRTEPYPMPTFPDTGEMGPTDSRYGWYYYVEDINGTGYWIYENYTSNWANEWASTNMLVTLILDPDASYIANLASKGPVNDIWSIFWNADRSGLTGDEVFVYSSFYYQWSDYYDYYFSNYTWYDEENNPVDQNQVIPNLAPEYEWASYMNGTYEYEYDGEYSWFGYDVTEMYSSENYTQWMEHYFSGLSVFNDTNNNGIMDIVYHDVPYDWNGDGVTDYVSHEIDYNASELLYDFYSTSAELGEIQTPTLNEDSQIVWSASVDNINGDLYETTPYPIMPCYEYCDAAMMPTYEEPFSIPVSIDKLQMNYRFEVNDEAAVLKIDQYVGDFSDPITHEAIPELDGLGITINYWSTFSNYVINSEFADGSEYSSPSTISNAMPAPGGKLLFHEGEALRTSIEFGGNYTWGMDGETYDVGTAVMPMNFYTMNVLPTAEVATPQPAGDAAPVQAENYWSVNSYYYSSCYSNWSGYSITHDPVFMVFPGTAPAEISGLMNIVVLASISLGAIGIIATSVVLLRINATRKSA